MRPLELTIEGFRSYRERVTFDWRGRRLVGIVGPIGSGKSSILDAVSFALYGKTPQVEGATKSLIHQLCRPVARRAPVPGGRAGVASRAIAPTQGRVRASARAAGRRHARRAGPRGGDARGRDERADRTDPRDGLQDVLSLRPAGAEPVLRVPQGDARAARRGAERASSGSSGSTTRSAWRRCTSSGSIWSSPPSAKSGNGSSRRASSSTPREPRRIDRANGCRRWNRPAPRSSAWRRSAMPLREMPPRRPPAWRRSPRSPARCRTEPTSSPRPLPHATPALGSPRRRTSFAGRTRRARPATPSSHASRPSTETASSSGRSRTWCRLTNARSRTPRRRRRWRIADTPS